MFTQPDKNQDHQAARRAALRSLAVRSRSVADLHDRICRRFGQEAAHTVVHELQAQGFLDDSSFATAWRESRERGRPQSATLVRRELLHQGVDQTLADSTVADMDDVVLADRAARSRMERLAALDDETFQRRLAAFLARRGFSTSLIFSTVRRLAQERETTRCVSNNDTDQH